MNKQNLTNNIRRVRNKLKIFEMEGSGQLMADLIDLVVENARLGFYSIPLKTKFVNELKATLQNELDDLLAQQERLKQGKLDL